MKNKITLISAAILLVFSSQFCKAQSNANWQPLAFVSGTSTYKGIQAYCMTTTCNGNPVVFIKFVNTNDFSVKAGWKDMIVTKENEQLNGTNLQDSVTIAANSQVAGACSNSTLALKLSDFGTTTADFKYLVAIDFDYVIIQ